MYVATRLRESGIDNVLDLNNDHDLAKLQARVYTAYLQSQSSALQAACVAVLDSVMRVCDFDICLLSNAT